MHAALMLLKALNQSGAPITILTVMSPPQHIHGKNRHAFLTPRQCTIHSLLFMNCIEMDILFHNTLQQFTECSIHTGMINDKQIDTAALPSYPLQTLANLFLPLKHKRLYPDSLIPKRKKTAVIAPVLKQHRHQCDRYPQGLYNLQPLLD